MKPVVYFDFKECENDNNSVVITKDRLKEILDEQDIQMGIQVRLPSQQLLGIGETMLCIVVAIMIR